MINRRSLIPLIIGVISAIVGLSSVGLLRQGRCVEAGGHWAPATQQCSTSSGALDVARLSDQAAGLVIGLFLAFMLHRASTFMRKRRADLRAARSQ